jgi:3'(2'), 5'-bisphosphate nucleotidase
MAAPLDLAHFRAVAIAAVRRASKGCVLVQQQHRDAADASNLTADTLGKEDHSPVTVADFLSQAVINCTLLGDPATGAVPVVAEEDSNDLRSARGRGLCARLVELFNSGELGMDTVAGEGAEDASGDSSGAGTGGGGGKRKRGGVHEEEAVLRFIEHGDHGGGDGTMWAVDPIDGTKGFIRCDQYAVALGLIVDGRAVLGVLGCPNLPHKLSCPEGPRGTILVGVVGPRGEGKEEGKKESTEGVAGKGEGGGRAG